MGGICKRDDGIRLLDMDRKLLVSGIFIYYQITSTSVFDTNWEESEGI
jgi:hypothetical protein